MARKATPDVLAEGNTDILAAVLDGKSPEPEPGATPLAIPPLPDDFDQADWEDYGQRLTMARTVVRWAIGDWMLAGDRKWGEVYNAAMAITGLSRDYLRDSLRASRAWQLSDRSDKVSWTHHYRLASLDPDQKRAAIADIVENGLSVRAAEEKYIPKSPQGIGLVQGMFPDQADRILHGESADPGPGGHTVNPGNRQGNTGGASRVDGTDLGDGIGPGETITNHSPASFDEVYKTIADLLVLDGITDRQAQLDALTTGDPYQRWPNLVAARRPNANYSTVRQAVDRMVKNLQYAHGWKDKAEEVFQDLQPGPTPRPPTPSNQLADISNHLADRLPDFQTDASTVAERVIAAIDYLMDLAAITIDADPEPAPEPAPAPAAAPSAHGIVGWSIADDREYDALGDGWDIQDITRYRVALRMVLESGGYGAWPALDQHCDSLQEQQQDWGQK